MTGWEPGRDAPGPVLAPGQQATLLAPATPARLRWRAVDRDGARLPAVAELGIALAQALALAGAGGVAWIVGNDEHAVEIRSTAAGRVVHGADAAAPRWARAVEAAARRPSG